MTENRTMFADVGKFHQQFGLPVTSADRSCGFPDDETLVYRLKFLQEELAEFQRALSQRNLSEAVDALADLAWVALGTAHYFGAPFENVWDEIFVANMAKVLAANGDQVHKRGPSERIRKPVGWHPPDIRGVIMDHNVAARQLAKERI